MTEEITAPEGDEEVITTEPEETQEPDKPEVPDVDALIEKRIGRFTKQVYGLRSEIDKLREENEALKAPKEKPYTKEDFGDDTAAYTEYVAERKAEELFQKHNKTRREQEAARVEQDRKYNAHRGRVSEFVKTTPDYLDVIQRGNIEEFTKPEVIEDITESSVGPQLAYYLSQNPYEAERLSNLSERAYNREFIRLEDKFLTAPAAPVTTKAPPPTGKPTGSTVPKAGEPATMEEWYAQRKKSKGRRR
jgi:regulator of replication initiation timing